MIDLIFDGRAAVSTEGALFDCLDRLGKFAAMYGVWAQSLLFLGVLGG